MSEKKTTKVYLVVECEVSGFEAPRFADHAETARDIVENAINKDSGNFVLDKYFTFTWMAGQVLVGKPIVLPDDINDILWRDKYNKMSPSQMLVALKEKWDTEAEGEDVDHE